MAFGKKYFEDNCDILTHSDGEFRAIYNLSKGLQEMAFDLETRLATLEKKLDQVIRAVSH